MIQKKRNIRIHTLLHVEYEGLGSISTWIKKHGYSVNYTCFYESPLLPSQTDFDILIVMGGPMNIYEDTTYSWLAEERKFIKQSIQEGKIVLGICLGSQLIANALGAKVFPNQEKEIGWFPIRCNQYGEESMLAQKLGKEFLVFHWHGDTFDLPANSIHLYSSETSENQAFIYDNRVVGIQFHLEVTAISIEGMMKYGIEELSCRSKCVQTRSEIESRLMNTKSNNLRMEILMDYLVSIHEAS